MHICEPCKTEMVCETTGVSVRFGDGSHTYSADRYRCPCCGTQVLVTAKEAYNSVPPPRVKGDDKNVWMVRDPEEDEEELGSSPA